MTVPTKELLMPAIKKAISDVGAANISMKDMRKRLAAEFADIDFKEHKKEVDAFVMEAMGSPELKAELAKAAKATKESQARGGTKKRAAGSSASEPATKAAKKEKDVNAPKRPQSAYFLFSNDVRPKVMEEVRAANDGKVNVAQVGTKIGVLWGAIKADDKVKYEAAAAKDKERYAKEMETYVPPAGTKAAKKEKDANAPKRPQSAYFLFSNDVRPKVMEEVRAANDGKVNVAQVGTKIGVLWGAIKADDKVKYEAAAAKDKERYATEMETYVPPAGTKAATKEKDANAPKRPQSAYFLFANDVRPRVMEEVRAANDGKVNVAQVGTKIGVLWGAIKADDKVKYEAAAAKDKERYAKEMEAYKATQ